MDFSNFFKRTTHRQVNPPGCVNTSFIGGIFTLFVFTIVTQNLIYGVIAGVTIFAIMARNSVKDRRNIQKKYQFLSSENDYTNSFLQLVSLIIKADGKTTDSELRYIESALNEHYTLAVTKSFMDRLKNVYLKKDLAHIRICRFILENYTLPERIQIIHLLSGVSTADGILSKEELHFLKEVAKSIQIPYRTFLSILG